MSKLTLVVGIYTFLFFRYSFHVFISCCSQSQIRQEACKSLYRLCVGQRSTPQHPSCSSTNKPVSSLAVMVLSKLLELLPIAVSLDPLMCEAHEPADNRKSKIGVSCQDYLWLTSQLLDNMDKESLKQVPVLYSIMLHVQMF